MGPCIGPEMPDQETLEIALIHVSRDLCQRVPPWSGMARGLGALSFHEAAAVALMRLLIGAAGKVMLSVTGMAPPAALSQLDSCGRRSFAKIPVARRRREHASFRLRGRRLPEREPAQLGEQCCIMATVSIKQLRKAFGTQAVVHGVDLEIADKEFLVLVGPSGCGKSTILRMIAGLEEATGGEIRIDGEIVNERDPKDRDIAMVFQDYALYPHMTVAANMAFSLLYRGVTKSQIKRARRRGCPGARHRHIARALSATALGRTAPARRHGTRHRARSEGIFVRRAAVQPRCQTQGADAHRDQTLARAFARPRRSTSPTTK